MSPDLPAENEVMTLRGEQKRLTRRKLMESAAQLFKRKGYARTTIDDIVAGAGASRGTFYLYFPSKTRLVVAIIKQGYRSELVSFLNEVQTAKSLDQNEVRRLIERYVTLFK